MFNCFIVLLYSDYCSDKPAEILVVAYQRQNDVLPKASPDWKLREPVELKNGELQFKYVFGNCDVDYFPSARLYTKITNAVKTQWEKIFPIDWDCLVQISRLDFTRCCTEMKSWPSHIWHYYGIVIWNSKMQIVSKDDLLALNPKVTLMHCFLYGIPMGFLWDF